MSEFSEHRNKKLETSEDLVERVCYRIYQAGSDELYPRLGELKLVIDYKRAMAVDRLGAILVDKLMADGYIVVSDIHDAVDMWHEEDIQTGDSDYPTAA